MADLDIYTLDGFFKAGGMTGVERAAAQRAILEARASWLPILEAWAAVPDNDLFWCAWLDTQIRQARRGLRLRRPPASPEALERRRRQTLERVRRYRQRQRQKSPAEAPGSFE
jgi:hypothetical protein